MRGAASGVSARNHCLPVDRVIGVWVNRTVRGAVILPRSQPLPGAALPGGLRRPSSDLPTRDRPRYKQPGSVSVQSRSQSRRRQFHVRLDREDAGYFENSVGGVWGGAGGAKSPSIKNVWGQNGHFTPDFHEYVAGHGVAEKPKQAARV